MQKTKFTLKVTKTLYHNTYRCMVQNEQNEVCAHLSIIPQFPLSKDEIPANAPEVPPFLTVLVEDADIDQNNLIAFEENLSVALLDRFTTEHSAPHSCQFFYPSPAFFFTDKNLTGEATVMQ